jgi:hypothetical protein
MYFNLSQKHLLLKLLRVLASEEQQHWQVLGWSCGVEPMKIIIEYQDQFGKWHRFQEKHNAADAYQVAKNRAESTKKRHRLVDGDGHLLDLIN